MLLFRDKDLPEKAALEETAKESDKDLHLGAYLGAYLLTQKSALLLKKILEPNMCDLNFGERRGQKVNGHELSRAHWKLSVEWEANEDF